MQKVEIIFLPFATNRSPRYLLLSKISLGLIAVLFFSILSFGAYVVLNQATAFYHYWQLKSINANHAGLLSQMDDLKFNLKKLNQKIHREEDFLKEATIITETPGKNSEHLSSDNFILTRHFSIWEENIKDWSTLDSKPGFSDEISEKMPKEELLAIFSAIDYLEFKLDLNRKHTDRCFKDMSKKFHKWAHTPTVLPLAGPITSPYGVLRPQLGGPRKGRHKGVDIAGPLGVPLRACAAGKVLFSGWSSGYGNLVVIDHLNGYFSYYGHCLLLEVKENQMVTRYQEIAQLGSTGRSTGPHVHFEIRKDDVHRNPMNFIEEEDQ